MRVVIRLVLMCVLMSAPAFCSSSQPSVNSEKALVIDGVIARHNLDVIGNKLLQMVAAGEKNADLVISSPGGEVVSGFEFVDKMEAAKAMGLRISCFVPDIAASMAFTILIHCDKRYTLSRAFLLWHRARMFASDMGSQDLTSVELLRIGKSLADLDDVILSEVLDAVDMSPAMVLYHFNAETLHVGEILAHESPKFITAYDYIPGLYEALENKALVRNKKPGSLFEFQHGELVYIWNNLLTK